MRGLPPVPIDVLELHQDVQINNKVSSIGYWLFQHANGSSDLSTLNTIIGQWFLTGLPPLLACMHDGAQFTTCRLSARGLAAIESAPSNHGQWEGGQADNVAMGMKWATDEPGRRGWALTYVPAVPDVFIDFNWQVSATGWGNLLASSRDLYNALNALPSIAGPPQAVGTVHRQAGGLPLPAAEFSAFTGVVPTPKVVTIRRRIPNRRAVSTF